MIRKIGYILGGILMLDGLTSTINPHYGMGFWQSHLRGYLPETMNDVTEEYYGLSDNALRYLTVWEAAIGAAMIWMASRARD